MLRTFIKPPLGFHVLYHMNQLKAVCLSLSFFCEIFVLFCFHPVSNLMKMSPRSLFKQWVQQKVNNRSTHVHTGCFNVYLLVCKRAIGDLSTFYHINYINWWSAGRTNNTLNVSDEAEYHEVFKLLIPVTSSLQTVIKRVHYRTCNILVLLLYKGILRKR